MTRGSDLCGVLIVDKPEGPTSHDMVALVRRLLGTPQIGHAGTLDPMATGVLVLCVGRATRLARFLTQRDKTYDGRFRLGWETDTQDRTGQPLGPPRPVQLEPGALARAMESLTGDRHQVPPRYSAKRLGGVRAHRLARAGHPRTPAPVPVTIHVFRPVGATGSEVSFEVRCSSGTYVRALVVELGRALGCGAHLTALRRLRSGEFGLEAALPMDRMEALAREGELSHRVIPPGRLEMGMPAVRARPESHRRLAQGGYLLAPDLEGEVPAAGSFCRIVGPGGGLLAMAEVEEAGGAPRRLQPRVVLVRPWEVGEVVGAAER